MSRNRVIYQSEALFVSEAYNSALEGDHVQLNRVQSANYSFNVNRQDINQYGQLARIDSISLESPTVSFDFSYYLTDGYNEKAMGFSVQTGAQTQVGFGSGHMSTDTGRNFYIVTSNEGTDLIDETLGGGQTVIGIGNGFLSDYTFEASVGNIPTVNVSVEGLNIRSDLSGTNFNTAAVNPTSGTSLATRVVLPSGVAYTGNNEVTALKPGDIVLNFGDFTGADGTGQIVTLGNDGGAHVQSVSLSLPLSRTPLEKLGSKFAYARVVDFPVTASLSVNAIVNEIDAKNLAGLLDDNSTTNMWLTIAHPTGGIAVRYDFKGAILQDESFSSSIGANKSVDLTFTTQIGGPVDSANNVFMSGSFATAPF